MKDVHRVEFEFNGLQTGEGVDGNGSSKRTATVALWLPSVQNFYLAERENYFLEHMER